MTDPAALIFVTVASTLFIAELTDKDAFLLLAVSAKMKAAVAFLAGVIAFTFDTALIVAFGSLIVVIVPVNLVRLAGGVVMIGYGVWQAKGLMGQKTIEEEESRILEKGTRWGAFLTLVGSLIVLDLAGDATEILTIVFVARYPEHWLVFAAVTSGLILATAVETFLGSRLGRLLTPRRLRVISAIVFLALGSAIVLGLG